MPRRGLPAPLRVLTQSQYGLFFAGNVLSLIGTWMQRIACSWLVWEWTGSAFWLGVLAAGDLLPVVFIGPFAGVAADRWDRLRQNRIAQVATAVLAVLMAVLLVTGGLELWSLIALMTLQGVLVAAVQPARLAMVQQMVPREDTGTAIALNSVGVNLARLLGPAVAGAMILHMDIVWIFLVNAAVTFLFVGVLGWIRLTPRDGTPGREGFMQQLTAGFSHVLNTRALWLILLVLLMGGIAVRSMLELMPAIAAESFGNTAAGLAVLTGSAAAGAVLAGLTMGRTDAQRLLFTVLIWWSIGAVAAVIMTQGLGQVVTVVAAVLMGACMTRGLIGTQTFVQLTTPDGLRGRTLSVHGLIARGSPAVGALLLGFAADRVGLGQAVLWAAVLLLLLLAALVPLVRRSAPDVAEAD